MNKVRVGFENVTNSWQVLHEKPFLVHFSQMYVLGPSPHPWPQPP